MNRHIEIEITNYLAGECTLSESTRIADLIQSDPQYNTCYHELKQIWDISDNIAISDTYNTDIAWQKVNSRITNKSLTHSKSTITRQLWSNTWLRYASGVAAVILVSFGLFYLNRPISEKLQIANSSSTVTPIQLSDGSTITLNKKSELKFPKLFGNNSRVVYFWGEAFFEIASDPAKPFVVETGDLRVKVLGTSFNINAIPGSDYTEVAVNSGKVLFYRVDKFDKIIDKVELKKGETGVFNHKTQKMSHTLSIAPNTLSWKTGILVFSSASLDKVFETIGHKYNVDFHLHNAELAKLKLTATFDNESLDSILEVIGIIHKLQFKHNGTDYLVTKKAR